MSAPDTTAMREFEAWLTERCPNDLGDDNHRWGWANIDLNDGRGEVRDIWWLHTCTNPGPRKALGRIDISTGERHVLHSEDPLHIEASVLCVACRDHGFIRNGRWVAA